MGEMLLERYRGYGQEDQTVNVDRFVDDLERCANRMSNDFKHKKTKIRVFRKQYEIEQDLLKDDQKAKTSSGRNSKQSDIKAKVG